MRSRLKVGLVGCGVGLAHARAYVNLPDKFELAAICDIDESRASETAEEFGTAHTCTDFDALCSRDDLDVIDICTPSYLHFQHARQALAAGKHIICEKPVAGSLKEADVTGPTHEYQEARRGHGRMKPVNREGTV